MYKIIGVDGKEYGPVNIDVLRKWIDEGRVNGQTRLQGPSSLDYKPAAEFPEVAVFLIPSRPAAPAAPPSAPPSVFQPAPASQPQNGLAVTSFVLGILSVVCLGIFAGIPAIICGHIAHSRSQSSPDRYAGGGFAVAGFVLGYVSLIFTILVAVLLVPAMNQGRNRANTVKCVGQMRQIGLAFRIWGVDHNDAFPFNVSTNQGGTKELCAADAAGFDKNAWIHFMSCSNELGKTSVLLCPQDTSKHAAADFASLNAANVTYRLRTGSELNDNTSEILAECPIHGIRLLCNGNVEEKPRSRRLGRPRSSD